MFKMINGYFIIGCSKSIVIANKCQLMMMYSYIITVVGLALASVPTPAIAFKNPILENEYYDGPAAIKVNDTYYVVSKISNRENGIFPIHSSTDLVNWQIEAYVFDGSNNPTWSRNDALFDPKIYKIGNSYLLYFTGYNDSNPVAAVGVAVAPHPLGPYKSTGGPILSQSKIISYSPTIINDGDKLFLMWTGDWYNIYARQLNSDGLSFSPDGDQSTQLLKPTYFWEYGYVKSSWYFRRGSYHYIIYTGCFHCSESGIGVARSTDILGPYEKLPNPIIVANSDYKFPLDGTIVKDLDDQSDLILFTAYQITDENRMQSVLLSSLSWTADDWPYVIDF